MRKQHSFEVNHLFQCLNLYIMIYGTKYISSLLLSKANRNDSISYFGVKQHDPTGKIAVT